MDRLTERDEFGNADIIGVDSQDLQSNLEFKEFNKITEVLNRLAHYEELEEKGLLIEIPCKVGDTVYEIFRGRIQKYTIISIHISRCSRLYGWTLKTEHGVYSNVNGFEESAIGTKVFLTQSEAEQALERQ